MKQLFTGMSARILPIVSLAFVLIFLGCKDENDKKSTTQSTTSDDADTTASSIIATRSVEIYPSYISDESFKTFSQLSGLNKRFILRTSIANINLDKPTLRVVGYVAKTHAEHGEEADSFQLKTSELLPGKLIIDNSEILFGNNYIDFDRIRKLIKDVGPAGSFLIKFTPQKDGKGNIYFVVSLMDTSFKKIEPKQPTILSTTPTNPSPPAVAD